MFSACQVPNRQGNGKDYQNRPAQLSQIVPIHTHPQPVRPNRRGKEQQGRAKATEQVLFAPRLILSLLKWAECCWPTRDSSGILMLVRASVAQARLVRGTRFLPAALSPLKFPAQSGVLGNLLEKPADCAEIILLPNTLIKTPLPTGTFKIIFTVGMDELFTPYPHATFLNDGPPFSCQPDIPVERAARGNEFCLVPEQSGGMGGQRQYLHCAG